MKIYFKQLVNLEKDVIQVSAREETERVKWLMKKLEEKDFFIPAQSEQQKFVLRPVECITFFTSQKKVYIVTEDGELTTTLRLYQLEEILPDDFVRISNTEIINLKKVTRFTFTKSGIIEIYFENGYVTSSSRRYLKRIKERLE